MLVSGLDSAGQDLRSIHGRLSGTVGDAAAGWRGNAAAAFQEGQTDANLNLDRLIQALENLRELVHTGRNDLEMLEDDITQNVRAAQSGLHGGGNRALLDL